ncbi:MAG: FtsX-like permease family protein, partial [Thermoplasmata archaeon]|nr:FtsX-like permease family protein [Thermoplasmata archaeon]
MALGLVGALVILLAVVGLLSLAFALRYRLSWRIAMRNVRRGRWRTVLVVFGLLVATTIVSGSLVIGDTVDAVNVHFTYIAYGSTDEAIYNHSVTTTYSFFPARVATALTANLSGNDEISGITPEIVSTVSVLDQRTHVPEPGLNLIGADPNASHSLGSFTTDSGGSLDGPSAGTVLLDDQAASDLNATAGDTVELYGARSLLATVAAVVQDDTRGGFLDGGNVFVSLATAQALENVSAGTISVIAVTNAGSLHDGVALADPVSHALNATLLKVGAPSSLAVHELLKDALAQAESAGSGLTTLFLVLGLFSIIAGAMLIIGIFVMIAEERKGEMGMLRAIGLTRPQLVLVYYFEGLAYSAGSALAGTFLGVGVGYLLTVAFANLFSGGGVTSSAILDSFTASTASLVTAYVVGFLLTLIAVTAASARVSRLNIVRAIRSMPEPSPTVQWYTYLAYIGIALGIGGALLYASTYAGTSDISLPLIGGALLIFGGAFIGSRFVPNRAVFTTAGIALLVW